MRREFQFCAVLVVLASVGGCHQYRRPSPNFSAAPSATGAGGAQATGRPTPPDHIIIIFGEAEPDQGPAPLTVKFKVSDPFKNIQGPRYRWDFGDGSPPSDMRSPKHVYEHPGRYTASVTVTDSAGVDDDDTVEIDVNGPGALPPAKTDTP